jgi:hypothetical protein
VSVCLGIGTNCVLDDRGGTGGAAGAAFRVLAWRRADRSGRGPGSGGAVPGRGGNGRNPD